ncbi:hypothetical protein [Longimicrobium sp.]|uniref:hypothetical protein n=1 Tax=Longimicrobium sp. TaxID=2029185 RepID=UPI002E3469AE|nr:hypothetical protein [Longimicrobium sp.]HEX6038046.1 hypothetical protein [Longimicrobium sp.]
MSDIEQPTMGRIVHYVDEKQSSAFPAIVRAHYENAPLYVALTVFHDSGPVQLDYVGHSDEHTSHTWHWPERAPRREPELVDLDPAGAAADELALRLFPDGNQWCALIGANLQEGISGFGATPPEALRACATSLDAVGVALYAAGLA